MINRYYMRIFLCIHMFLVGNVVISSIKTYETDPEASNQRFNFELYNKLKETIYVRLKYFNGENIFEAKTIEPKGKIRAIFSYKKNNQPTELDLKIWNRPKAEKSEPIIYKKIEPCGGQQPCSQTIYLTLDKTEYGKFNLRPQTGQWGVLGFSLKGVTDSGLSMKNNVKVLIPGRNIDDI